MKHIKRFNESIDDIKLSDEIKEIIKDCFIDYITDYGMTIQFVDGFYVPGYHFMTNHVNSFLSDLRKKYPEESKKFDGDHPKCIKVDFLNEGIGRIEGSRLNIYLDENSKNLFDESIHNLRHQLKLITAGFQLMDVPEKLSSEFYGIQFLIIYE